MRDKFSFNMYFILNEINSSEIFNKINEFYNFINIIIPKIMSKTLMYVKTKIMSKIMNVSKNKRNSIKERI